MANETQFENLADVKRMLEAYRKMSDGNQSLAGLGSLTVLVSAMIKMVDEIESLKAATKKGE